jgi:alkylated DNA repair protein alkB family protein 1
MVDLDAHQRPPDLLRNVYKEYTRRDRKLCIDDDTQIEDFATGLNSEQEKSFEKINFGVSRDDLSRAFGSFNFTNTEEAALWSFDDEAFCSRAIDGMLADVVSGSMLIAVGLIIIPHLIPLQVQLTLLSRMFHRDLSSPLHKTNVDLHYLLNRPPVGKSFFEHDTPSTELIQPRDPSVHKPITHSQLLEKKLRWMTIGGQYNWTQKVYPDEKPPEFPEDIKDLLSGLFPQTTAEAAIVNLYSPGDTLSLHRDVSEECDQGLISISIGCDCLFIIGLEAGHHADATVQPGSDPAGEANIRFHVLRLKSGDAVYMSGASRFAWHGVPLIIPDTCPNELRSWPASPDVDRTGDTFEHWRDWLSTKRVNLNVRQMKA